MWNFFEELMRFWFGFEGILTNSGLVMEVRENLKSLLPLELVRSEF